MVGDLKVGHECQAVAAVQPSTHNIRYFYHRLVEMILTRADGLRAGRDWGLRGLMISLCPTSDALNPYLPASLNLVVSKAKVPDLLNNNPLNQNPEAQRSQTIG